MMEIDSSTQPGLEPVRHPDMVSGPKPENSAYGSYGGPPYGSPQNNYGSPPPNTYGSPPPNTYGSPQNSYGTPTGNNNGYVDPYVPPQEPEANKSGRRICGLATATFALLVALVVCIIAAAVGGGVGGTIAVNNAKKSCQSDAAVTFSSLSAALASATRSSTSTASQSSASKTSSSAAASSTPNTATQPWGPVGTDIGQTGCPDADGSIYTSTYGPQKFKIYCNEDQPGNDLLQTLVTTFGLCMEACASWNLSPSVSEKCAGVAYIPSFIDGDGSSPVDCFLKSVGNASALAPNGYVVDFAIIQ